MERFTCDWLYSTLVVLCDGKVVCGCADPYGLRPLGDASQQTLREIWNSEKACRIREGLNNGYAPFCVPCGLKCSLRNTEMPPVRTIRPETISRLFIEPTVLCNLDCYKSVCNRESGIRDTRRTPVMDFELFTKIVDETGAYLDRMDFFNYGESFVHPRAVEMLEYFKSRYPRPYVYISTNGLMLDEEKILRLVAAGIDEITFSVDGADQLTYQKYRTGGNFERVMRMMELFVKIRNAQGREVPFINWRYILFSWNDSDVQMQKAREMAEVIGVDRLTWEITDHPDDAKSIRFQPGTKGWKSIYHEIWDTSHLSNAIKSKRYRATIGCRRKIPLIMWRDTSATVRLQVTNTAPVTWWHQTSSGRRLVRLGAQLHDGKKRLINRDYARAFLPGLIHHNECVDIALELPPLESAGLYWLKLDMVSEGIDWFENGGSSVRWIRLIVV
jgi:hypothetical protein